MWRVNKCSQHLDWYTLQQLQKNKRLCAELFEEFMNPKEKGHLIWNAVPTNVPNPAKKVTSTRKDPEKW